MLRFNTKDKVYTATIAYRGAEGATQVYRRSAWPDGTVIAEQLSAYIPFRNLRLTRQHKNAKTNLLNEQVVMIGYATLTKNRNIFESLV